MISIDKESLECDLLETYGIYDMRELPINRVALFSNGLKDDSRIYKKMNGANADMNTLILAGILDRLSGIAKLLGSNIEYTSLFNTIQGIEEEDSNVRAFEDAESFEKERLRMIGGIKDE